MLILLLITVSSIILVTLAVAYPLLLLRRRWASHEVSSYSRQIAILLAAAGVISSPYLAYKAIELKFALDRVPEPLHAWWIDVRMEEASGFGLPGANETGFVAYRLTRASQAWAQSKGSQLGTLLPGGAETWHPTPVVMDTSAGEWPRLDIDGKVVSPRLSMSSYLDKYGALIPLSRIDFSEVDRSIRRRGSFYSFGKGGSITIVNPEQGRVFFAYAG